MCNLSAVFAYQLQMVLMMLWFCGFSALHLLTFLVTLLLWLLH